MFSPSKTIIVDVDGVIRDIYSTMNKIYEDKFGEKPEPIPFYHGLNVAYPKLSNAWVYFFDVCAREVFQLSRPYMENLESLRKFHDAGWKIILATFQDVKNYMYTVKWVEKWKVPHDMLVFTEDKEYLVGAAIIEDSFNNAARWAMINNRFAFLVDRSWNQDSHHELVVRVKNVNEVYKYLVKK